MTPSRLTGLLLVGTSLCAIASPAAARDRTSRSIDAYVEASQVITADLSGPDDDVLTYTSLAAGVNVAAHNQRIEVQASYRYEHRFSWDENIGDDDVHSGLARVAAHVTPALTIEGGALATRARADIRGDSPQVLAGNVRNISQVYSAYAGPTLATTLGDFGVNAGYRIGYTKVEAPDNGLGIPFGQPRLDRFDHSLSQLATASIGTRAGTVLPIGFTLSGAYQREDAGQLDQRYIGKYARLDTVLPVLPTLALTAGVGYEDISIRQRDPALDLFGQPVTDGNGRFVTDKSTPRRLAYQTDGVFYDAGVVWRPSSRTTVQARVGKRYDTVSYTGSVSYAAGNGVGLQVGVYDSVTSFGRGLTDALATLPTSFVTRSDPFGDQYDGCVFGRDGKAAGNCLSGIFQSIATNNYRARGIDGVLSVSRGPVSYGVGAGYANRRFLAPGVGYNAFLEGVEDQSYYAQAFISRGFSYGATLGASINAEFLNPGLAGAPDIFSAGGVVTYGQSFGRLGATASVGLSYFDQEGFASDLTAQALLGLHYGF